MQREFGRVSFPEINLFPRLSLQLALLVGCAWVLIPERALASKVEGDVFRFEFDNDLFFHSDNLFTDGWSAQWHSPTANQWNGIDSSLSMAEWGRIIPTLGRDNEKKRHMFGVGHYMQTPSNLLEEDFIPDDAPYAGALVFINTWYSYSDIRFSGFEMNIGVAGPNSYAEQGQKAVHRATDSVEPLGWDNQVKSRAVINLGYMQKYKFLSVGEKGFGFDLAASGNVVLGTVQNGAEARLESRFGYNIPRGFSYTPDEVTASMMYDASLEPIYPNRFSLYGSLQVSAKYVGYNYFLEGNTYNGKTVIEPEDKIAELRFGLHYLVGRLGFHFTAVFTTDIINKDSTIDTDINNNYGDIAIEYRW